MRTHIYQATNTLSQSILTFNQIHEICLKFSEMRGLTQNVGLFLKWGGGVLNPSTNYA